MGKLVTIVGSNGSGKTTLARLVCQSGKYTPFLEELNLRPFQASFMKEREKLGLPNQIDFLLYRAEQEMSIRTSDMIGVQDGGLDLDYYIFSRLFLENKYLTKDQFVLVQRFYHLLRTLLPPPDCIVRLNTPLEILVRRRNVRQRELDLTANSDLHKIDRLFEEWFAGNPPTSPVLEIDYQPEDTAFSKSIGKILDFIEKYTN